MKPILILKTGSTFSAVAHEIGDFEDWIITATGEAPGIFAVADGQEEPIPPPGQLAGVIVTGSHSMVSNGGSQVELWSRFLRDAVRLCLPVLGVCYGHQLLAQALGGVVADHPRGLELGQVEIQMAAAARDDPLFSVLPAKFFAYATHMQSIHELPPAALIYGSNDFESHHAVRFAPAAWGVQFHPEFNQRIMQTYIEYQRPRLKTDAEMNALREKVTPLPEAGAVLQRFCQLVSD
jgi:GMP synthase (glutamine-hydrolysing)